MKKKEGFTVYTKHCPKCDLLYRYQEYEDGYFNYNNSSFFSNMFLEKAAISFCNNVPLSAFLKIEQGMSKVKYTEQLVGDALKAFMALKDIDLDTNCYQCGKYPPYIIYDAIRNVCFDLEASDVVYEKPDVGYQTFKQIDDDACKHDLARGLLKNNYPAYKSDLASFSVTPFSNLPPYINMSNALPIATKSTRITPGEKHVPEPQGEQETERAEESRRAVEERIEMLSKSKRGTDELINICRQLGLSCAGGRKQMLNRIMAKNPCNFSILKKNFTKLTGKSGGVLRGVCPHGCVYFLKFLTLPEGASDYTVCVLSCKWTPTVNVSDSADLVAINCNKARANTFRPHNGMLGNPADEELVSSFKSQGKKAELKIGQPTGKPDPEKNSKDMPHITTGRIEVLSLYDRLHEKNHKPGTPGHVLRKLDNIKQLEGKLNSSRAESKNNELAKMKPFVGEMGVSHHIKTIMHATVSDNIEMAAEFKRKQEKALTKRYNKKTELAQNYLGFLQDKDIVKSEKNLPFDDNFLAEGSSSSSILPSVLLQCPLTCRLDWLNFILYLFHFTPLAESVKDCEHYNQHTMSSLFELLTSYNLEKHVSLAKNIMREVKNRTGNPKHVVGEHQNVKEVLKYFFIPVLDKCEIDHLQLTLKNNNLSLELQELLQSRPGAVRDYIFVDTGLV